MSELDPCDTFAALKKPSLDALARILYMKASTTTPRTTTACNTWLGDQYRQVSSLKDPSVRRQRTLSLMADVFIRGELRAPHETLQAQDSACLCESHKELNPRVLSELMTLVTEEATICTDRYRHFRDRRERRKLRGEDAEYVGGGGEEMIPAVAFWLDSISRISVLWMGKTRWEDAMRKDLGIEIPACARYRGCVACKLAVVGGSVQFLMDLRASLLSRREYHKEARPTEGEETKDPKLLRMVESWIDVNYAWRRRSQIRRESETLVPMLVVLRGEMSVQKRRDAGIGGARRKRESGERLFTKSGWPMPLAPVLEEDESGDEGGKGKGRVEEVEGYSRFLPQGGYGGAMPEDEAKKQKRKDEEKRKQSKREEEVPKLTAPRRAESSTRRRAARPNVEPPWATTDYDPPSLSPLATCSDPLPSGLRLIQEEMRRFAPEALDWGDDDVSPESPGEWDNDWEQHVRPVSSVYSSDTNLSAIYGWYLDAEDDEAATTGSKAPSAVFSRGGSLRRRDGGSPASSVTTGHAERDSETRRSKGNGKAVAVKEDELKGMGREDRRAPPMLRDRHMRRPSGIPAPLNIPSSSTRLADQQECTAEQPKLQRDDIESVYSVSSTALMGSGQKRRGSKSHWI